MSKKTEDTGQAIDGPMEDEFQVHLETETLVGNARDFLLDRLKDNQDGRKWNERKEEEQRQLIQQAGWAAKALVVQLVNVIAAEGRDVIPVRIEKVLNDAKEIKIAATCSRMAEQRHDLFDASGSTALLVLVEHDKFTGAEEREVESDQGELPIGEQDGDKGPSGELGEDPGDGEPRDPASETF